MWCSHIMYIVHTLEMHIRKYTCCTHIHVLPYTRINARWICAYVRTCVCCTDMHVHTYVERLPVCKLVVNVSCMNGELRLSGRASENEWKWDQMSWKCLSARVGNRLVHSLTLEFLSGRVPSRCVPGERSAFYCPACRPHHSTPQYRRKEREGGERGEVVRVHTVDGRYVREGTGMCGVDRLQLWVTAHTYCTYI